MTPLDNLEKLADEATPGPWTDGGTGTIVCEVDGNELNPSIQRSIVSPSCKNHESNLDEDAAFIAAANPATIKTLIQVIREAREALAFYANREMYMADCELGDITEWELDCYGDKARKAEAKIDALLEGIK